jgi:hypothetical protein
MVLGIQYSNPFISATETNQSIDIPSNKTTPAMSLKLPGREGTTGVGDDQTGGIETQPKQPRPEVIHLRFQVDSISVYSDRDSGLTDDGEFHLLGLVTCCGGAANSVVPAVGFPFKSPGQPDGEIDTPTNIMNDVRGTYRGSWGTVSTVKFTNLYVDVDVDNNDPRAEVRIDFFGMEDDRSSGKLPALATAVSAVGTAIGNPYVAAAGAAIALIDKLVQEGDANYLGNVQKIVTKSNNYGVGFHYDESSKKYANKYYPSQRCEDPNYRKTHNCRMIDHPDFPEYIINYRIIDKDHRCIAGWTYDYIDNICRPPVIN